VSEWMGVVFPVDVSACCPGRGDGGTPMGEGRSVLDVLDAPPNSDGII